MPRPKGRFALGCRSARLAVAVILMTASVAAADWPQYRGPQRDGRQLEARIAEDWTVTPPREVWRRPLGESFSGLAIAGDRLLTLFSDAEREYLGSFDAADGKELWRLPAGQRFEDQWGDGGRSTPTVTGDRVLALSSYGRLVCAQTSDGKLLWQVDFPSRDAIEPPTFGYSPSPLVIGELVISEVGGSEGGLIAAFELATGKTRWSTESGRAGYASPVVLGSAPDPQIVFLTRAALLALDTAGRSLWRWPLNGGSQFDLPIAAPVAVGPSAIFASHRAEGGSVLLDVEKAETGDDFGLNERWQNRFMQSHFHAPVYSDGYLYGFHNATLKAIDTRDASLKWARRGLGKGSLILLGERLVVLTDDGELALIAASPEGYVEHGRYRVFDGISWTAPSFAEGRLFLRDTQEMVALDLRPVAPEAQP